MKITVTELKQILIEKKIEFLFHVNTVSTSIVFFHQKGLLSRGAVEERGFFQTPQRTDNKDKELDIFNDIFFDSVDIHERAKIPNSYGPVTFIYSINVLDILYNEEIRITQDNPMHWEPSRSDDERYFMDVERIRNEYKKGKFRQHLTIRNIHYPLPFSPYLVKVLIEDPGIKYADYFEKAYNTLHDIMNQKGITAPLEKRQCSQDCKCREIYRSCKPGYTYYRFQVEEALNIIRNK